MSEQTMTEENKKTIVAIIAGLLIGGLLVFIFSEPAENDTKRVNNSTSPEAAEETDEDIESTEETEEEMQEPEVNDEVISVSGQTIELNNLDFPADAGWVGIRDYEGGQLTGLLGVARWNKEEGLMPTEVPLLRSTVSGNTYAIVFYSDNGDKRFDLSTDAQMSGEVTTFVAK